MTMKKSQLSELTQAHAAFGAKLISNVAGSSLRGGGAKTKVDGAHNAVNNGVKNTLSAGVGTGGSAAGGTVGGKPNSSVAASSADIVTDYAAYSAPLESKRGTNLLEKNIEIVNEMKSIETENLTDDGKIEALAKLKNLVGKLDCEIKQAAIHTVFGDGNPLSKIMVVGEAPGEEEDKSGVPFCGRSGQLLGIVLESINLIREENFYICNSVFWRPPANRKPTDAELQMCQPFFEKHVAIINPTLIIACGATAMGALLGDSAGITKKSGTIMSHKNQFIKTEIPVMPIYHPSYLLRNPIAKKIVWENMITIRQFCRKNNIVL